MDEFVRRKLTEWNFANLIERFKEQEIDEESLLCLGDKELDELIETTGRRVKFKKRLEELKSRQMCEQPNVKLESDLPSSSTASEHEQHALKRKLDQRSESPGKIKRQCGTVLGSHEDELILNKVKGIMGVIHDKLSIQKDITKLNAFLRSKIFELSADKKELVGVFGKTGAGKSSLINAIVEEKNLLPTGSLTACTTVMIKVEANTLNKKYEAEIEFISKEDWKDELWSVKNLFGNEDMEDEGDISEENRDDDEEYNDVIEKMTALYGDEWRNNSPDDLMRPKYFKGIPEFLKTGRKIIEGNTAKELSAKVLPYTRTVLNEGKMQPKQCFWPLVKCVTLRMPNNDLLKHVTLVDLPGNGDRNKSRDQMWKKIVASCSTVWIVSEMNRAASDRDAWNILENTCSLMGNGGECQNIYFICTKSDSVDESGSARDILNKNSIAKDVVRKEFNKLPKVKKQFKYDCFHVFTVSSKEFLKPKCLQREETEIPKLQDCLQSLNDEHDQTLNYVTGAYGILSLIQGAKQRNVHPLQSVQVREKLKGIIQCELQKVNKSMNDVLGEFGKCLSTGVEKSKSSCEVTLNKILNPKGKGGGRRSGRGFHVQLRCALKNKGVHKAKEKQININNAISNFLTDSIDEEFRRTFPNDAKSGPFYQTIVQFSLDTTRLVQEHKDFKLLLTFLKTEESNIKTKLYREIRDRKKKIYSSLTETVADTMHECYTQAANIRGSGSLEKMKSAVESHLRVVKGTIFDQAKDVVLSQLKQLMEVVQHELSDTLVKSIELTFDFNDKSIPDFGSEFDLVKQEYDKLTGQSTEDLSW